MHAIMVIETVLDDTGHIKKINVLRAPSHASDVTAAVREMIQRVTPFSTPAHGRRHPDGHRLVDRSRRFQLDALSEGHRSE